MARARARLVGPEQRGEVDPGRLLQQGFEHLLGLGDVLEDVHRKREVEALLRARAAAEVRELHAGEGAAEDVAAVEGVGLVFTVTLDNAVQGGTNVDVTLTDVTATGGAAPLRARSAERLDPI